MPSSAPKAPAEGGGGQQDGFWDAPAMFFCTLLVRKHKQESKRID